MLMKMGHQRKNNDLIPCTETNATYFCFILDFCAGCKGNTTSTYKGTDTVAILEQKRRKPEDFESVLRVNMSPSALKVACVRSADPLTCYLNVNLRVWLRLWAAVSRTALFPGLGSSPLAFALHFPPRGCRVGIPAQLQQLSAACPPFAAVILPCLSYYCARPRACAAFVSTNRGLLPLCLCGGGGDVCESVTSQD